MRDKNTKVILSLSRPDCSYSLYFYYTHNQSFILKAVKNTVRLGLLRHSSLVIQEGNVEPFHFYEQTCEVSLWLKAGEAQPCLTSLRCRPLGFMKLYTLFTGPGRIWALPHGLCIVCNVPCAHTTIERIQEGVI